MKLSETVERAEAWDRENVDKIATIGSMRYVEFPSGDEGLRFTPKPEEVSNGLFSSAVIVPEEEETDLTFLAQQHLATKTQAPPHRWLFDDAKCTPELRQYILNYKMDNWNNQEREFLLRQRFNGDMDKPRTRAVLSDRYEKFDHFTFLNLVKDAIAWDGLDPDTHFKVERFHIDDSMSMYLSFPLDLDSGLQNFGNYGGRDGERGNGNGGIRRAIWISNNEVGGGSARIHPAIWRMVCSNGLYAWSHDQSEGFSFRHISTKEAKTVVVADALTQALSMSSEMASAFVATQTQRLNRKGLKDLIGKWTKDYTLPLGVQEAWEARFTGRDSTWWDHINYVTENAQQHSYETGLQMERMAGAMVNAQLADRYLEVPVSERGY